MINQINLLAAICKELDKQGVKTICQRQTNAIIAAVNGMIHELERDPVMTSPNMGLQAWLTSDDTGLSSRYMASVLGGWECEYNHPHDLDDFGRCSRLLKAVPEFRSKLERMRTKSPQWTALMDIWEEVEALIESKDYKTANAKVMSAVG
jgi:hypothetical protein